MSAMAIQSPVSSMLDTEMKRLASFDVPRLRDELAKAFRVTVEQIVRMAAIIRLLEDRGEDLDDIKSSMLGNLRRVAYGQILPEVLVQLQSAPNLLARVCALPLPDQQRVVSGQAFKVMIVEGNKNDHRLVEPLKMSASEIRQVFASDHIRDEGEQVSWLRSRPGRVTLASQSVEVDSKRKGIVVTGDRIFISRSELVNLLARVTD